MNHKWSNFRYESESEGGFTSAKQPLLSFWWPDSSLEVTLSKALRLESKTKSKEIACLAQCHKAR